MDEQTLKVRLSVIKRQLEVLISAQEVGEIGIKQAARDIGIKSRFDEVFDWLMPFSYTKRFLKSEVIAAILWVFAKRNGLELLAQPRMAIEENELLNYWIKELEYNESYVAWTSFYRNRVWDGKPIGFSRGMDSHKADWLWRML